VNKKDDKNINQLIDVVVEESVELPRQVLHYRYPMKYQLLIFFYKEISTSIITVSAISHAINISAMD
jgi:hypothetical protein